MGVRAFLKVQACPLAIAEDVQDDVGAVLQLQQVVRSQFQQNVLLQIKGDSGRLSEKSVDFDGLHGHQQVVDTKPHNAEVSNCAANVNSFFN